MNEIDSKQWSNKLKRSTDNGRNILETSSRTFNIRHFLLFYVSAFRVFVNNTFSFLYLNPSSLSSFMLFVFEMMRYEYIRIFLYILIFKRDDEDTLAWEKIFYVLFIITMYRMMRGNGCFFDTIPFFSPDLLFPVLYTQFIYIYISHRRSGHCKYCVTRVIFDMEISWLS